MITGLPADPEQGPKPDSPTRGLQLWRTSNVPFVHFLYRDDYAGKSRSGCFQGISRRKAVSVTLWCFALASLLVSAVLILPRMNLIPIIVCFPISSPVYRALTPSTPLKGSHASEMVDMGTLAMCRACRLDLQRSGRPPPLPLLCVRNVQPPHDCG